MGWMLIEVWKQWTVAMNIMVDNWNIPLKTLWYVNTAEMFYKLRQDRPFAALVYSLISDSSFLNLGTKDFSSYWEI